MPGGTYVDEGSSPLTRGKQVQPRAKPHDHGLIPAHTGKTPRSRGATARTWAHPRSRGENTLIRADDKKFEGSSPLPLGKRALDLTVEVGDGLIPAHAGKTPSAGQGGAALGGLIPAHAGKTS